MTSRAYYERTTEKIAEQARRWKRENPERAEYLRRRWLLREKYGITPEHYDERLSAQGGGCAICGRSGSGRRQGGYLLVDHDAETGIVRGLLCHPCNVSLGHFRHDPDLLVAAAMYLVRASEELAR